MPNLGQNSSADPLLGDAAALGALAAAAERCAPAMKASEAETLLHAHYAGAPVAPAALAAAAALAPPPQNSTHSSLQSAVAGALEGMGYHVMQEVPILGGLRRVDFVVRDPAAGAGGAPVALEVDGPSHFFSLLEPPDAQPRALPSHVRRAHVTAAGLALRTLSMHEWNAAADKEEKRALLRRVLAGKGALDAGV